MQNSFLKEVLSQVDTNIMLDAPRDSESEIFNIDQGSQLTADTWVGELKENGIQISMDGNGRDIANIFIE